MSDYNDRVLRLKSPEECERFARNVEERGYPVLAKEARRRAVELRAIAHGAESDAEREALEAIYAVEEVLSQRHGRRIRAARTWQSIRRHGILQTVERLVSKSNPTAGYTVLEEMGMSDFSFEAVVLRHQALFQPETVERAKSRIDECKNPYIMGQQNSEKIVRYDRIVRLNSKNLYVFRQEILKQLSTVRVIVSFYIYENWQAGPHKAVLHNGSCGFCNNGQGLTGGYDPEHGTWHGPFSSLDEARGAQERMDVEIRSECRRCVSHR